VIPHGFELISPLRTKKPHALKRMRFFYAR